eukprot:5372212-Pyramimonas_sp.AAC.1
MFDVDGPWPRGAATSRAMAAGAVAVVPAKDTATGARPANGLAGGMIVATTAVTFVIVAVIAVVGTVLATAVAAKSRLTRRRRRRRLAVQSASVPSGARSSPAFESGG